MSAYDDAVAYLDAEVHQRCDYDIYSDMRDIVDEMEAENAKLRELCANMWRDIPKTESCGWDMSTNTCTGSDECIGECSYWYRMRDLGIEVDDDA